MEAILSILFSPQFMCVTFIVVTWFWWVISRRFFTFLFYFSQDNLKLKKNSWQYIVFNYGIFGPLSLVSISGYMYALLIFFKFLIF